MSVEIYKDLERVGLKLGEITDMYSSNWSSIYILPRDIHYQPEILNPDYIVLCDDDQCKNLAIYIEKGKWSDFKGNLNIIKSWSSENTDFQAVVVTNRNNRVKKYTNKQVDIHFLNNDEIKPFYIGVLYRSGYSYENGSFLFTNSKCVNQLSMVEVCENCGKTMELLSQTRLTSVVVKEIVDGVARDYMVEVVGSNIELDKFTSFEKVISEEDIDPEVYAFLHTIFKFDSISVKIDISIRDIPCNLHVFRNNGEFGRVMLEDSDDGFTNIQDIINPKTRSYYQEYAKNNRILSPHISVYNEDTYKVEILSLDKHKPFYSDVISYKVETNNPKKRSIQVDYTRLLEVLGGFEDSLKSYYLREEELCKYNYENPGSEEFLPPIQDSYVNSVRTFFNSWYVLMGAIAVIFSSLIYLKGEKLSACSVTKQVEFYENKLSKWLTTEDITVLKEATKIRSMVIDHPKAIGTYNWITISLGSIAFVCFYSQMDSEDSLTLDNEFLESVKKEREYISKKPLVIEEDKLWINYFPVSHPNKIFKTTIKLLDAVFLMSLEENGEKKGV